MESKANLVKRLNDALAQEHACQIRYLTHAAAVTGPWADAVAARLKEIAEDEKQHAIKLRDRITALGGVPTMDVARDDLIPAKKLKEIIDINLKEEMKAIELYRELLRAVGTEGELLYETIEEILQDEQEHQEELERLRE